MKTTQKFRHWLLIVTSIMLLFYLLGSCTEEPADEQGVLNTPSNVSAIPGIQSNTIQWDAVMNATYYRIYWSNQSADVTTNFQYD